MDPSLVESDVKYFLSDALKKTHEYKMKTYSFILNLAIGAAFFIIFGGFLYYRYNSKPTPQEKHEKMMRDQAIVMSKIRGYHESKEINKGEDDISKLPFVDMDYYVSRNKI